MAKDCSFDVVSEFDAQELVNAVDQTKRDITSRFDLKDSNSQVDLEAQKLKNGEANTEEQKVSEAESAPPPEEATAVPALANSISALAPILSKSLSGHSKADDKRACLLRALKPYMSEGRCEAIEYIIKISLISDVLKNLS